MITNIFKPKNLAILLIGIMMSFSIFSFSIGLASAQVPQSSKDAACEGIAETGQGCDGTAKTSVSNLLADAIGILSWIVGIASVIMIIVGGLKFILSNGDSNGVASARSTIIYALVGLVVAVLAQVMVQFVLRKTIIE